MSRIKAAADIAGTVGNIIGTIAGAKTRRELAKTGDKVQIENNANTEHMAMLQFRSQNSFNATNRTKFDSLVDGLNRLVFPLTAFPFIVLLWVLIFTDMSGLMKALGTAGLLSIVGTLLGVRQFGKYQVRKAEEKKVDAAKEIQKEIIKGKIGDDFVNIETDSKLKKVQEFVNNFADMAENVEKKYGLPADGVLAHAALETGWGRHILTGIDIDTTKELYTNSIFNIKKSKSWKGKSVIKKRVWEDHNSNGKIDPGEFEKAIFRAYDSPMDSFEDYAKLITTKERFKKVTTAKTAAEYGQYLFDCGYQTDAGAPKAIAKIAKMFDYET